MKLRNKSIFLPTTEESNDSHSLANTLVKSGATLVAKNYVEILPDGRISAASGASLVDLVLLPEFQETTKTLALSPVAPGQALIKLLPSSVTSVERSLSSMGEWIQAREVLAASWSPTSELAVVCA